MRLKKSFTFMEVLPHLEVNHPVAQPAMPAFEEEYESPAFEHER